MLQTGMSMMFFGCGPSNLLKTAFGGKLKVDESLTLNLLAEDEWRLEKQAFGFSMTEPGTSDQQIIAEIGSNVVDRNQIFAAIEILDSPFGAKLLQISPGLEEKEVVVGYIDDQVIYLEHELEQGKEEEYHLHMRPKKLWKRAVTVLVWK